MPGTRAQSRPAKAVLPPKACEKVYPFVKLVESTSKGPFDPTVGLVHSKVKGKPPVEGRSIPRKILKVQEGIRGDFFGFELTWNVDAHTSHYQRSRLRLEMESGDDAKAVASPSECLGGISGHTEVAHSS